MGLSRRERREQRRKLLKEQRLKQLKALEQKETIPFQQKEYKGILKFYEKHYKKFFFITITLLVLAIISIGYFWITTGDFINKGVTLKGGVVITIPVEQETSINELRDFLKTRFPGDDIEVRSITELGVQKAVIITTDNIKAEKEVISALAEKIPGANEKASAETTGESLGKGFFKQTMIAMLISFLFMAIVVFFAFKTFTPSFAVITCAFADIIETLALTNLLGIKVSTAGIAAFLMLIGYSVDTDILLTTRVLKSKEGTVFERIIGAARTGLMMTLTAIIAVVVALIFTQSETIKEIMTIMLIGLIFDLINTWLQNASWLRIYAEKRKTIKTTDSNISDEDNYEEIIEGEGITEGEEKEGEEFEQGIKEGTEETQPEEESEDAKKQETGMIQEELKEERGATLEEKKNLAKK